MGTDTAPTRLTAGSRDGRIRPRAHGARQYLTRRGRHRRPGFRGHAPPERTIWSRLPLPPTQRPACRWLA